MTNTRTNSDRVSVTIELAEDPALDYTVRAERHLLATGAALAEVVRELAEFVESTDLIASLPYYWPWPDDEGAMFFMKFTADDQIEHRACGYDEITDLVTFEWGLRRIAHFVETRSEEEFLALLEPWP